MAFTHTTSSSAYAWRPDVAVFAAPDVLGDALLNQCSVVAGAIDGDEPSVKVAFVNDDTASFVAEGAAIPEAEPELAEVAVFTGKISQLVRVSREQFFQEGAADQISESVARALIRKADLAFLTQPAPVPPATNPAAGILETAGIIEGGAVSASLDEIVDLIAEIQINGGTPTHIVIAPDTWAELRKLKFANDSNQSLLGAGTNDAPPLLFSLPVLVNVAVPSLQGLVLDRNACVSAVGPVLVATSQDAYFASDSVGLRATWRVGQALVRPDRVATFTISAGS